MAISPAQFSYQTNQVRSLSFEDATSRLAGYLQWLEKDTKGAAILKELREYDVDSLVKGAGFQSPPKARSPEDVAAVAVAVIDTAIEKQTEVFQIAMAIGVRGYSSRVQDTMDQLSERYLYPLYDYLEMRLFQEGEPSVPIDRESAEAMNTTDVFVVHGRDEKAKLDVARFLERLDLNPIILHEQSNRGRTVIEKFEQHAEVQFAVVILSPDDVGRLQMEDESSSKPRARQNVVFEMGYFIGRIGRSRVFPLKVGDVEIPSDYAGVAYTPMDQRGAWKSELVRELKAADFNIDANKVFA